MPEPTPPTSVPLTTPTTPPRPGPRRRTALAGLAVAVGGAALLPRPAWGADDRRPGTVRAPALLPSDRAVVTRASAERALEHISALADGIGPRIGGTPSEHAARDYLAGVLDDLGYTVELESFPTADRFLGELAAAPGTAPLPDDLCWQVGASPQGGLGTTVTGAVVDLGTLPTGEWPADLAGAVVLLDAATLDVLRAAVPVAAARGAVAVVRLPADAADPVRRTSASSPTLVEPTPLPVVGVAQAQKARLRAALATGPLSLQVSTTAYTGLTSSNVLAERRGRLAPAPGGEAVMVCAHYDTVIGAPGANDDGSGTGLCLELARVLRPMATRRAVKVALWGAEELGLVGSRYHVAQLPPEERARLVAVLNNDMVATSWDPADRYWVLSWDGQANAATDAVVGAAERLGYGPRLTPVFTRGASDHQSFQEVGVAAGNFSWRGEAAGQPVLEPPYHSPEDTVARNISLERLQVSLELVGSAAHRLAGPSR